MSDRLTLTAALEDAGIQRDKAEHVATVVFEAIRGNVATKADLELAVAGMRADIHLVRADLDGAVAGLRADIGKGRADLDIAIAGLRADLAHAVQGMKIWTGTVLVGLVTLQLAGVGLLIRYLPHG